MQCINRFFFSFIFLCGISLNSSASCQECDSLYNKGKYFEASIEFERLIFHAKELADVNYYRYRKALCYKEMGQFGMALGELRPIYLPDPCDSLYCMVCYEQSLCFYLDGKPAMALWKIDEFFHRSPDSASFHFFMPLKILCLNAGCQWEEAKNSFLEFVGMQGFSPSKKAEIEQIVTDLYGRGNLPRIRSAKKAESLSRFFPGAGQMYSGSGGEGIVNFLINASILTFAGVQAYNGFYFTGYLAGLGFFNKTYHGGIKRAGVLASEKNNKLMAGFNEKVTELVLSDFGALK